MSLARTVFLSDWNDSGTLEGKEIQHSARVTEVDADGNTTEVGSKQEQCQKGS